MQQDAGNEFCQALILDLDMQCVKSLTDSNGWHLLHHYMIQSLEAGVFLCQITPKAPLYQQTFVTRINLVRVKLSVFMVCLLFLSWTQNGNTISQGPKQSPHKNITPVS